MLDSEKPFQGLEDKVRLIADYYVKSQRYPSIRKAAEDFSLDERGQPNVVALFARLRSHVRYIPDPVGTELIKAPWVQMTEIGERGYTLGDCDDAASLAYTMLHSIGVPAQLAVGWYGYPDPSHIWVEIPTKDGGWLAFDLCARMVGITKEGASRVEHYG
jgi:transglutaminase-like putative cysteine protease